MKISIVVTYLPMDDPDIWKMTDECIRRIKINTFNEFELVFAMNGKTQRTYPVDVIFYNDTNKGNADLWDNGVRVASNNLIVLMDNDVWVEENWDKEMVERLSDENVGITFPYSILGDEINQSVKSYKARRGGFCFAFRKAIYDKAGPFLKDQPFHSYYEDDMFEYVVQHELGLKLVACESSKVWHKGKGTSTKIWDETFDAGVKANEEWYNTITNSIYPHLDNV